MSPAHQARLSCLASNAAWRREARHLRELSVRKHLTDKSRSALFRESEAADRQANWWLNAAIVTTETDFPRLKRNLP